MTVKAKRGPSVEELAEFTPVRVLDSDPGGSVRPDFRVWSGAMQVVSKEASSDGKRRVRCIASSSTKDLHGDTMTEHCIRSMAKQAPGLTIFLNHKYGIPEDVFGYCEKARTKRYTPESAKAAGVPDDVIVKATSAGSDVLLLELTVILDEGSNRADRVYNQMENGVTLGVSIGALITDYEEDPDYEGDWWPPLIINDVDLLEASVVGIPANPLSWIEGAAKGLIQRGAIKGIVEEDFDGFRRFAYLKEKEAAKEVNPVDDEETTEEPTVEASADDEAQPDHPQAEFMADGFDSIIAHFQSQVEAKLMSATDLDAMEDAVQAAIDHAVTNGVDKAEFEGETAKDIALQILNMSAEPALTDGSETADEGSGEEAEESADAPGGDQEAPESDPESSDAGNEAAKQAAEQIEGMAAAGLLSSLGETLGHFQKALEDAIAVKADNERLTAENARLTAELETAQTSVSAATEFVDKVLALPWGRKSVVRREAAGFAERLKGTPWSGEVLAYIEKHKEQT